MFSPSPPTDLLTIIYCIQFISLFFSLCWHLAGLGFCFLIGGHSWSASALDEYVNSIAHLHLPFVYLLLINELPFHFTYVGYHWMEWFCRYMTWVLPNTFVLWSHLYTAANHIAFGSSTFAWVLTWTAERLELCNKGFLGYIWFRILLFHKIGQHSKETLCIMIDIKLWMVLLDMIRWSLKDHCCNLILFYFFPV